MASDQRLGTIRFGDFEADTTSGELFREGQRVAIQRKPFQILELLLRAEGAIVTRASILATVWPDVHVEEHRSLNAAVGKLRLALGDDATNPRLIETVGSRGYRLLVHAHASSAAASPGVARRPAAKLLVLPFKNLSTAQDDYFADGLTEQLIAQFGRSQHSFAVIAPISAMHYKDSDKDLPQVGRELKSDYLLTGSVLRQQLRFRITAKLVRMRDQVCIWTDSYAGEDTDIFAVQDEITRHIAEAILRTIPVAPRTSYPTRASVYEKYLKAAYFAAKGSEPAFVKAVELFEEVISEDPSFAPGYASLALLLAAAGQYGVMPPKLVYDRVHALASQAIALSPELPEAHVAFAFANFFFHGEFAGAERSLVRALDLNPSCIPAYHAYGMLLTAVGRFDEALSQMTRARELDPLSPMANILVASTLAFAGRLPEALEEANRTMELERNFPTAHACLGWIHSQAGNHEAALPAYRTAVDLSPEGPLMMAHLAHGLAAAGHQEEARTILENIVAFRAKAWASSYWMALIHIALGDKEAALDAFSTALDEGDGWRVFAGIDCRLKPLHSDARFLKTLEAMGLALR